MNLERFNMKDIVFALLVGSLLALVLSRPLGIVFDQDNGDYKKHNKHYQQKRGIK
jgi:hypothetical protein